jgi:hypothetical protein
MSVFIEDSDASNAKTQIKYAVNCINAFASCAGANSLEIMTA